MRHQLANRSPSPADTDRPNSVGLRGQELATLLDEFDVADPTAKVQRHFVRWPFRHTSLRLSLIHPGGNAAIVRVACRNISRGGMSVLHSAYIHTGSRCTVYIPHPRRGEVAAEAWVARCTHRSRMVHEIGLAFVRPIDVHTFLAVQDDEMFALEHVDPSALGGNLFHADDCENSCRIFRHHVRQSALNVVTPQDPDAARVKYDIIVVSHPLADLAMLQTVVEVRERLPDVPLVVLTSQRREIARKGLASLKPDAVLVKPVQQGLLLRALGEYLIVRRDQTGAQAPQCGTQAGRPQDVAQLLAHCAQRLETFLTRNDVAGCRALCVQLAEAAPGLGVPAIARLAAQAAAEIIRSTTLQGSSRSVRALIDACRRLPKERAA